MATTAANKIRLGVIGFGRLGTIHAQNINASQEAELYAICDVNKEARERAETQFGVQVYENLSAFLALPLDGVVIASNTCMHIAHILAATEAGVAIFTEKPIGLTLEEADTVLQKVVDRHIPFQIGFQRRWDPRYIKAKKIIKSEEIGKPVLVKAFGRDPNASSSSNWGLDKNGGLFLNAAIHDYDAVRFLVDQEVQGISANGDTLVHSGLAKVNDIDTCTTTLFLDGAMAITEWSRYATYGYDIGLEIIGTEGMVSIARSQKAPLVVYRKDSSTQSVFEVFADAYKAEIEGFITAIKQKIKPTPGVEDARIALHLALTARRSYENQGKRSHVTSLDELS